MLVPTAGLEEIDPEAPLAHVLRVGTKVPRVRSALSCAFGFGGMDTLLVLADPGAQGRQDRQESPDVPARGVAITAASVVVGSRLVSGPSCATLLDADANAGKSKVAEGVLDTAAHLDAARARRLDRCARLGLVAVESALRDAGAPDPATGLVLGSAFGNVDGSAEFMHRIFEKGPRAASPAEFPNLVPSSPVGHASIYLGLRGPAFATADLGTSGESAFVQAAQLIATGEATRMVAGAVEAQSRIVERVLSVLFVHPGAGPTASAPRGRADFASAVVLEDEALARSRASRVLARVVRLLEWRGSADHALAQLPRPTRNRPEVLLARESSTADALLARTAWSGSPRLSCAEILGDSDGLGGVAVAVAAARLGAGLATDALIVGLDDARGYFIVLSAP